MTSSAPVGLRMISEIFSRIASESPSDSSVGVVRDLSIRRITTCSPSTVGSTATRMSSMRPTARAASEMRPSCGLRRSAMSSFASTFRRVVTPFAIRFGIDCASLSTPSMRTRTRSESSCGSKWMSLAPSVAACMMIELTSRTSGASETPSSTSRSSSVSSMTSNSSSADWVSSTSERRAIFSISAMMSSRLATPMSTGYLLASLSSSIPWMFPGSAIATRSRSPWFEIGIAITRWRVSSGTSSAAPGDDALCLEIDEGQVVAPREGAGDALGLRVALVAQRLGERAGAGAAAGGSEPVARDDLGREHEIGDEVADRLEAGRPSLSRPRACAARSPRFVDVRSGPAGSKFTRDSLDRGIGKRRTTPEAARAATPRAQPRRPSLPIAIDVNVALAALVFTPALAFGSFVNVVAARVPLRQLDLEATLGLHGLRHRDRGRGTTSRSSRTCCCAAAAVTATSTSRRVYPAVEALTAALVVACVLAFGATAYTILASFFVIVLVTLSAADLRYRLVPNRIVLPAAAICLVGRRSSSRARSGRSRRSARRRSCFAAALAYPKGMGMGDVKLALLLGAMLGREVTVALMIGFIAALVPAAVLALRHGSKVAQDGDPVRSVPRVRRRRRAVLRRRDSRLVSRHLRVAPARSDCRCPSRRHAGYGAIANMSTIGAWAATHGPLATTRPITSSSPVTGAMAPPTRFRRSGPVATGASAWR